MANLQSTRRRPELRSAAAGRPPAGAEALQRVLHDLDASPLGVVGDGAPAVAAWLRRRGHDTAPTTLALRPAAEPRAARPADRWAAIVAVNWVEQILIPRRFCARRDACCCPTVGSWRWCRTSPTRACDSGGVATRAAAHPAAPVHRRRRRAPFEQRGVHGDRRHTGSGHDRAAAATWARARRLGAGRARGGRRRDDVVFRLRRRAVWRDREPQQRPRPQPPRGRAAGRGA